MTSLLRRSLRRDITTLEDYVAAFSYAGSQYSLSPQYQQTLTGDKVEVPGADLVSFGRRMYVNNGPVFACMSVRALVFSAIRLTYQRMAAGRPSALFGTRDLALFETPWVGGTTQDLLALMIQDADLAGNSYWTRSGPDRNGDELVRLQPDWVEIVLERRDGGLGHQKIGYLYWEGGVGIAARPVPLLANEVAHFMPTPDPAAPWRGMSWLRTVFTEVANDRLMERYKTRTLEQGATPNMVVKTSPDIGDDGFDEFVEMFRAAYSGPEGAGKTMILSPGVDVEVVGQNFQQLDYKKIQGHAETRIAAAAGVPVVIVGFSEGLAGSSLNAGNYGSARRRFADGTMHPLWQSAVGSLSVLAGPIPGARLWYDTRDVPFVREDESDIAEIQANRAQTLRTLTDAGYTPQSAVAAVEADDFALLEHSGLFSVQLQPPGTGQDQDRAAGESQPTEDAPAGASGKQTAEAARAITEMVQKIYLGVGKVITADEARQILNDGGASLAVPGPPLTAPPQPPAQEE